MAPSLPVLLDGSAVFGATFERLVRRGTGDLEAVAPAVREILTRVRREGDHAVRHYVQTFEKRSPASLVLESFDGAGALARLAPEVRDGLKLAAQRIESYHRRQWDAEFKDGGGFRYEEEGVSLGLRVRPIARLGVYAPGGKARYPSSVLMSAIPARVAGVKDVVLATPAPDDQVLAAAHLSGVTTLLDAGGAQAIAAMAYGTSSLRRVDKIVGPGSAYVACAKRMVFGDVAIDGIAGPSEILVIADDSADPRVVAADLLSQAEHDEDAYAMLVTTSDRVARAAAVEVLKQLEGLERRKIAGASIERNAAFLVVKTEKRLVEVADALAAEHVAFHVQNPEELLARIGATGAALVGAITPVAAGDYLAGPSHVLPTGGCVRFGSPLGVYDFVARSSVIRYSPAALRAQGPVIAALARAEGLTAHARAVEVRLEGNISPGGVSNPESDD